MPLSSPLQLDILSNKICISALLNACTAHVKPTAMYKGELLPLPPCYTLLHTVTSRTRREKKREKERIKRKKKWNYKFSPCTFDIRSLVLPYNKTSGTRYVDDVAVIPALNIHSIQFEGPMWAERESRDLAFSVKWSYTLSLSISLACAHTTMQKQNQTMVGHRLGR